MATLTEYFQRKVGAKLTRTCVVHERPIPGEDYGYTYRAEVLAVLNRASKDKVSKELVVVNVTRQTLASAGTPYAGTLVRFGDYYLGYKAYTGLTDFWQDLLETLDELESATVVATERF